MTTVTPRRVLPIGLKSSVLHFWSMLLVRKIDMSGREFDAKLIYNKTQTAKKHIFSVTKNIFFGLFPKTGHSRPLFLIILYLTVNKYCLIKITDVWIGTQELLIGSDNPTNCARINLHACWFQSKNVLIKIRTWILMVSTALRLLVCGTI